MQKFKKDTFCAFYDTIKRCYIYNQRFKKQRQKIAPKKEEQMLVLMSALFSFKNSVSIMKKEFNYEQCMKRKCEQCKYYNKCFKEKKNANKSKKN